MSDFQLCYVCRFIWCLVVFSTCTFLVFWRNAEGWWFLLALLICEGNCDRHKHVTEEDPGA